MRKIIGGIFLQLTKMESIIRKHISDIIKKKTKGTHYTKGIGLTI